MTPTTRVLAFGGSLRRDSYNHALAAVAAEAALGAGAEVTLVALRDLPMPVLDQDIEKELGLPENAKRFKALMKAHDALLVASPENNGTIGAALKNALDWASRQEAGEEPLACFKGKVCGLLAASPGALGGLRGLVTVRAMLSSMQVIVVPEQVTIAKANEAFDEHGKLKDAKQAAQVERLATRVVEITRKLKA